MTQEVGRAGTWLLWGAAGGRNTGDALGGKERGWGGGRGSRGDAGRHWSEEQSVKKVKKVDNDFQAIWK